MRLIKLYADVYPGMVNQAQVYFHNTTPTSPPSPPNKRIWVEVWVPGDEELFPELFDGVRLPDAKSTIENS